MRRSWEMLIRKARSRLRWRLSSAAMVSMAAPTAASSSSASSRHADPGVEVAAGDGPGGALHGFERPGEPPDQPQGDGGGGGRGHHARPRRRMPPSRPRAKTPMRRVATTTSVPVGGGGERLGDPDDLPPARRSGRRPAARPCRSRSAGRTPAGSGQRAPVWPTRLRNRSRRRPAAGPGHGRPGLGECPVGQDGDHAPPASASSWFSSRATGRRVSRRPGRLGQAGQPSAESAGRRGDRVAGRAADHGDDAGQERPIRPTARRARGRGAGAASRPGSWSASCGAVTADRAGSRRPGRW